MLAQLPVWVQALLVIAGLLLGPLLLFVLAKFLVEEFPEESHPDRWAGWVKQLFRRR